MVDLANFRSCIVWLSERLKPTQERESGLELDLGLAPVRLKLRVDYQFSSAQWERFLPIHKSIPDDSILYAVLRGETFGRALENWSSLGCGQINLEAVGSLHAPPQRGVMALLSAG